MTRTVDGDATEFPFSVRLHDGAAHHAYCHNTTLTVTMKPALTRPLELRHLGCDQMLITPTSLKKQQHINDLEK